MASDSTAFEKRVKDQINIKMRSTKTEDKSLDRLRQLFLKTEEMKEISETRNQEMENQFKELQERINNSSGFLSQMKKSIENITFSYQREITDLEQVTEENRQDIDRQIEELREKVRKLQFKVAKEEKPEPENYQEAFSKVLNTLQHIAEGKYSSQNTE